MAKTKIMIKLANGKYIDMSKAVKPEDKVHKVMREFKEGKLKSSSGQVVTSRDQALAIAMSESGLSKNMIHDIAIEYDSMEKARPTKYIKRVPKPSGKGYYYFYTKQQLKDFHEKGIKPDEKKESGSFWDKVKSFFGNNADEKVNKLHEIVSGVGISVTKDSLAEHLAEYLSNKEKWDSKFRGEKKEKGETKPKTETAKSEKKESGAKKEGSKWNNNLMKFFSNQYGMIEALKKEEVKKEGFNPDVPEKFSKDYEKFAEGVKSDIKKNKNLSGYYLERLQKDIKQSEQRIKSIKKEAQSTGEDFTGAISKFEERIKDASILSKQIKEITGEYKTGDNFETMPEGEKDLTKEIENYYIKIAEEFSNEKPDLNKIKKVAKEKSDKINSIMNKEINMDLGGIVKSNKKITLKEYNPKDDKMIFKDSSGKVFETTFSKFEKENPSVFKSSPTSDAMPKEIERTERFPEVPTYAEAPDGFNIIKGTNAPLGYEFYGNGSPLKEGYKKILVKDAPKEKPSATEALKTEALKTFTIVDNNNPERTVKVQAKDLNEAKSKGASELKTTNIRTYESSNKVEALKDELGKKKGESKEREITVFGKQQKVKTKPIELNLGYEHPFEIAKRDFGNNRSDWVILESSTGLRVGDGKTQKDAIENAETMIKKYTKSESEFKQLVENNMSKNIENKEAEKETEKQKAIKEEEIKTKEKINKEKSSNIYSPDAKKLSYGSINMKNISDEKERMAFEKMNVSNMITDGNRKFKPLFSYSSEGQDQGVWTDSRMMIIDKKVADEIYNTNKQREFLREKKKNPNKSDDEILKEIAKKGEGNFPNYKQVIPNEDYISKQDAKFTGKFKKGDGKDSVNIAEYSDGENTYYFQPDLVATIKNKFPNAKMHLNTSGSMSPAVFKVGNEIKAVLMPMQRKDDSGLESLEKAISNLRQEIMLKAQPTKYIKRIPNPKGKGYIYFYTQQQVKDYEKSGKLPDDQQKKPESKQSTGKGNIEILKESIKKVASIFADALSAKDAVQPSGSAVEQTGENIAQKSKDKKRLEKQRDISKTTKKNTPEEKPTK
jgi:uncharacterized protein (DUF2249 family)